MLCDEVLDVDHACGAALARTNGNGHDAGRSITLPVGSSLFDVERAFLVATLSRQLGPVTAMS